MRHHIISAASPYKGLHPPLHSIFIPMTHLLQQRAIYRASPPLCFLSIFPCLIPPWVLVRESSPTILCSLLAYSGFSPSLDSDWPILLFPGLISHLFLYNFLFTGLDIFTLKMEAVSSSETSVNTSSITCHKTQKVDIKILG